MTLTWNLFLFQQIPTSFTKFFNGIAPCKIILIDHDGKCWDVKLEKIEGRLVFKNGWQQFAKLKNLEEGDFLVFQYDGMSTFNVKIFSKTGCRKGATPPSREKVVPIVNLEKDSDEFGNKIQSNGIGKRSLPNTKLKLESVLEGQFFKYSFCIISYHYYPKAKNVTLHA